MGAMTSQITSLTIVYSTVYSDADQRKHQSSASLTFVRGIHRWPVISPHKWLVMRKMFPFNDVIKYLYESVLSSHNLPRELLFRGTFLQAIWNGFGDSVNYGYCHWLLWQLWYQRACQPRCDIMSDTAILSSWWPCRNYRQSYLKCQYDNPMYWYFAV